MNRVPNVLHFQRVSSNNPDVDLSNPDNSPQKCKATGKSFTEGRHTHKILKGQFHQIRLAKKSSIELTLFEQKGA